MKEEQNGNWVLGDTQPRTMDSSHRGTWAPPKKPVTQAISMPKGMWNGTPKSEKGKRDLICSWGLGVEERSFQKGMDLSWNVDVPRGSNPCGSWTPILWEQPGRRSFCFLLTSLCSKLPKRWSQRPPSALHGHTHTHTHCCLLKPDMRSFF